MTDICPTCRRKIKRRNPQNAIYWILLHELSERLPVQGQTFSAASWHAYMKSKFLGEEELKLPNGKTVSQPNSSSDLDIAEFSEYFDRVSHWAAEHNVWLPE